MAPRMIFLKKRYSQFTFYHGISFLNGKFWGEGKAVLKLHGFLFSWKNSSVFVISIVILKGGEQHVIFSKLTPS